MPIENWKEFRLERIYKKLSALETALFHVSMDLECFIEQTNNENLDIDSVIYGQETIEGVSELLADIKNDIMTLS